MRYSVLTVVVGHGKLVPSHTVQYIDCLCSCGPRVVGPAGGPAGAQPCSTVYLPQSWAMQYSLLTEVMNHALLVPHSGQPQVFLCIMLLQLQLLHSQVVSRLERRRR